MNRGIARQTDKRVPIALSMLAAVLALLGAHQMRFPGTSPSADPPVQMASAIAALPAR